MFINVLMFVVGIILIPLLIHYDKKNSTNYHKKWYMWVIAFILIIFGFFNFCGSLASEDSSSSPKTHQAKKNFSKNLPGQKINKSKANKHGFYWTSKDDKKVRYFVNDNNRITAIKVVLTPDINNTTWCQAYMDNVLHDGNLKYGNDKEKETDIVLSNDSKYNIYSPKYKKWYWVSFSKADGDEMVSSFSIYPGKNSDAQ